MMSMVASHDIFRRLSSVGNTVFDLVTFRSWRLKPSMAFVVWINCLTASEYLKHMERVAQLSRQDVYTLGYLESHLVSLDFYPHL